MNNRAFLETWYRRVWLEEDLSAIDEMMAATAPMAPTSEAWSLRWLS